MQVARTDIRPFNEGYAMLVLTRRAGESIMIDNDIELKVLKIRGSQVHLGIDAPNEPRYIEKRCGCGFKTNTPTRNRLRFPTRRTNNSKTPAADRRATPYGPIPFSCTTMSMNAGVSQMA